MANAPPILTTMATITTVDNFAEDEPDPEEDVGKPATVAETTTTEVGELRLALDVTAAAVELELDSALMAAVLLLTAVGIWLLVLLDATQTGSVEPPE